MRRFFGSPTAALVIIVFIFIGGFFQFTQLPIALYPKTSKPKVLARVQTGTMTHEEFRSRYGKDIVSSLQAVKGVEKVEANYSNGTSRFEIEFVWGIKSDDAKMDVKAALSGFESGFPDDFGRFRVWFDGERNTRFWISLRSEEISTEDLTESLNSSIVPVLEGVEGVAQVYVVNWNDKFVSVELIPDRIAQYGLTFGEIRAALKNHEFDSSLGVLSVEKAGSFTVIADKKAKNLVDVGAMVVASRKGQPVYVKDVASVVIDSKPPDFMFKANGQKSLLVGGYAEPDANIKQVAEDFIEIVTQSATSLDPRIEIDVIQNPASFINEAVQNVINAVVVGMLIATFIVFLFLRSFKNTVVICISIPLSLIGGFVLMSLFGIELNLISLGAMALAVGMVVDGSIVVLENIVRHLEEKKPATFRERLDVIIGSVAEVRMAVIASLLTTIIVFAPLPFTSPLASAILGDLAVVMVCVLSVSVVVTLVFIPPLVVFFRSGEADEEKSSGVYWLPTQFNRLFKRVHGWYLTGLDAVLRQRYKAVSLLAGAVVFMAGGAWVLVSHVKREVMAKPATDRVFIFMEFQEEDRDVEDNEEVVGIYEKRMMERYGDKVTHTLSHISEDQNWVMLFLKDKSDLMAMKKELEGFLKNTPLLRFYIDDWTPTSLRIPKPDLVRIKISGSDEEERRATLEKVNQSLQDFDDLGRLETKPSVSKDDFLTVHVDKDRVSRLNTGAADWDADRVFSSVATFVRSENLYNIDIDHVEHTVKLVLPEDYFKSPRDLENQLIRVGEAVVPLKAFATVERERKWSNLETVNGEQVTEIWANTKQSFVGDRMALAAKVRKSLVENPEINGRQLSFVDTEEEVNENIRSLVVALGLALALICIVITLQFSNLLQTMIVMVAVPLGFIGVSWSLFLFQSTLSVNSMLGLILLCGTAVNNSILFLDFYNRIREGDPDMSVNGAIMETARLRFRPIMITTLTTILGMIPIALGMGSGGEILQPLGIAICGGLWISTLLTVFMVPLCIIFGEVLVKKAIDLGYMKAAATYLSLLMVGVALSAGDSEAADKLAVSVEQAVSRTLEQHSEVRIARSQEAAAKYEKRGLYSEVLPTVKIGRQMRQSSVEFDDGTEEETRTGQNFLLIEEKIPNPYKYWNRLGIKEAQFEAKGLAHQETQDNLRARARLQYFRAKVAERSLENARKNLEAAQQNLEVTRRRFRNGFVHSSDAKRSEASYKRVQAQLQASEEAFRNQLVKLKVMMGVGIEREIYLSTPVPREFAYFKIPEEGLGQMIAGANPSSVLRLEKQKQAQDLSVRNAVADYLPDLTLSARYERKDPRDDEAFDRDYGPVYALSAEWEIFSGGRSYHQHALSKESRYQAEEALRQAKLDYEEGKTRQIKQLLNLKKRYEIQLENLNIAEEIVDASRQRFRQGTVDSKQVNDDFREYLDQESNLLELSLSIIEAAATLSEITSRPKLFDDLT